MAKSETVRKRKPAALVADFILANPPFNISDWGGERLREDKRWQFGAPPAANANFAWVQHMVHHFAPTAEPLAEKMQRLTVILREQQAEAVQFDAAIAANLRELGYGE